MSVRFEAGQRVPLPGETATVTVDFATETASGWQLFVDAGAGSLRRVQVRYEEADQVAIMLENGAADPPLVLAGLWAEWMRAATVEAKASTRATTPLRPYAHQTNAVYGAMLPQPRLRFLLADEPGTGDGAISLAMLSDVPCLTASLNTSWPTGLSCSMFDESKIVGRYLIAIGAVSTVTLAALPGSSRVERGGSQRD